MSYIIRKLGTNSLKSFVHYNDSFPLIVLTRNLSVVPSIYDGEQDPAPKFFASDVQTLLKRLTRPDSARVFRKRTSFGLSILPSPKYKFMTDEELQIEMEKSRKKAERLLQMPPVVKVQKPIVEVLSKDPALIGLSDSKLVFTDITFGVPTEYRLIIERDTDGTLKSSDHELRKRINQTYFPMIGRKIKESSMFTDTDRLNSLLEEGRFEYVLDRACIQYDPDEPMYQKVTSITYQHVDSKKSYDVLRSTRHFGPLTFYLTWHKSIDNLILELLQTSMIREVVLMLALRHAIHADVEVGDAAKGLSSQIYNTPIQLTLPEHLEEEDINLDTKCLDCVEKYVVTNSTMRGQHELALQGFRESYKQLIELSRGLRKAHGSS